MIVAATASPTAIEEDELSEDMGTERAPQEEADQPAGGEQTKPPEIVHPDPLGGDDESGYGGAGQSETEEGDQGEQSGPNRPPSEQDEDQGI